MTRKFLARLAGLDRILWQNPRIGRASEGISGDIAMIVNATEYTLAEQELRDLEARLGRLQQTHPIGYKGFTKAGIRKMIARIHEELAAFEGSEAARHPDSS